ncbi:MAG: GAF domain-containing protein, partial [Nitrospinae bacterium]|nr:GAF domain-containing protein [Nitrospinota bacterium]
MSRSSDDPKEPQTESILDVEKSDAIEMEPVADDKPDSEGNGRDTSPSAEKPSPVAEKPFVEKRSARRFVDKLKPIIVKILSAESINRILFGLTNDLKDLFECEAITIYALDRAKRQLFSRNFESEDIEEIRLNVSTKSLAGFVAATAKLVNIADAYDKNELARHHADLSADHSWDEKLNFKTKSAMVIPLAHNKRLMGVLEILNKSGGTPFTEADVHLAREISTTLGTAMVKLELEDIEEKIRTTALAIHSADTIDEILLGLQVPILQLFGANLITIYAVDREKNEIYSKVKTGNTINEIRVPISTNSIAGCLAMVRNPVNIADVYT